MHAVPRHGIPSFKSLPKDSGVSCVGRLSGRSLVQQQPQHIRICILKRCKTNYTLLVVYESIG